MTYVQRCRCAIFLVIRGGIDFRFDGSCSGSKQIASSLVCSVAQLFPVCRTDSWKYFQDWCSSSSPRPHQIPQDCVYPPIYITKEILFSYLRRWGVTTCERAYLCEHLNEILPPSSFPVLPPPSTATLPGGQIFQ